MKSIQNIRWFASLALITVALAVQDAPIRRELKAGATETYKIENEIKQFVEIPSMGEQDMVIQTIATVALKTLAVNAEKGTADVEALTKYEKLSMEGSIAAMMGDSTGGKLPDPKTEKGTLDSRNRFSIPKDPKAKPQTPAAGPGMGIPGMGAMSSAMLLNLIALPEKNWKVGDTQQIDLPGAASMATMGVKDLKMTLKITGEKVVDGQAVWVLSYSGDMKLDVDPSKTPNAPTSPMGQMKMTGTAQITGEGLVDKATGKTVSNLMQIANKGTMFIEQAGMEIPMRGTVVMKLSLVK